MHQQGAEEEPSIASYRTIDQSDFQRARRGLRNIDINNSLGGSLSNGEFLSIHKTAVGDIPTGTA
jgi:hypothetical protein